MKLYPEFDFEDYTNHQDKLVVRIVCVVKHYNGFYSILDGEYRYKAMFYENLPNREDSMKRLPEVVANLTKHPTWDYNEEQLPQLLATRVKSRVDNDKYIG